MKYLVPILLSLLLIPSIIISQDYIIDNYDVNIKLSREGHFDVHEKITVTFNDKRRGIFKNVPYKIKIEGLTKKIKLSNVTVKDYEHKVLTEGNNRVIRIGSKDKYITGTHSYEISYRINNAIVFADDHSAFQYNLVSDWDTSIEKLSYNIELPDDLPLSSSDYLIMTDEGSSPDEIVTVQKSYAKLSGQSLKSIKAKENVTIAMKLPYNYITRPVPPVPFYKRDKLWFLPLGLLMLFINFFRRNREVNNSIPIKDEYFPPSEFSPAMVGAYYDNKINTEDIISLLPYWAEQGYIEIIKGKDTLFFKRIKSLETNKPEYQRIIFENIFISDDMVMLSDLQEKMYQHTSKSKNVLHKKLLGMNLYDEDYLRTFKSKWMIISGLLLIVGSIAVLAIFKLVLTAIAMFVFAIACFVMYFIEPKKSELGIRIKNHLLGLKQFLENSPKEKTAELIRKHPNYFEHMYPYAIAFGIDKTWTKNMQEFDLAAPYWYINDHNSHSNTVANKPSFNDFSKDFNVPEIKSVFTSFPQSDLNSGSGGRSGGGFSGGGAGGGFGGGGGSW